MKKIIIWIFPLGLCLHSLSGYGIKSGINSYGNRRGSEAAKSQGESFSGTERLAETGLSDDLLGRLGGLDSLLDPVGHIMSQAVRGAVLKKAQHLSGEALGSSLGSGIKTSCWLCAGK
ncbi:MAG: hypothetical protein AAF975_06145 [Spirochaetota bacterium]